MLYLNRPYHFNFLKGCLPQIFFGSFLNTLLHIINKGYSAHYSFSGINTEAIKEHFNIKEVQYDILKNTSNLCRNVLGFHHNHVIISVRAKLVYRQ